MTSALATVDDEILIPAFFLFFFVFKSVFKVLRAVPYGRPYMQGVAYVWVS